MSTSAVAIEEQVQERVHDLEIVTNESEHHRNKAQQDVETAAVLLIQSDADYLQAESLLVRSKLALKEIDARFDPIVRAADQTHTEALRQKNIAAEPWKTIIARLSIKTARYLLDQQAAKKAAEQAEYEARQLAAMEAHEAEIQHAEANEASAEEVRALVERPVAPPRMVRSEPAPVSRPITARTSYKGIGENLWATIQFIAKNKQYLPLLKYDESNVNKMAGALKTAMSIPGIRVIEEVGISTRTAARKGSN